MVGERLHLGSIERVARFFGDALFPRHCVRCHEEGSLLCDSCRANWLPVMPKGVCFVCKKEAAFGATCSGCMKEGFPDGLITSAYYGDPTTNQLIRAWKYHYDHSAWNILHTMLAVRESRLHALHKAHHFDAIVPLALHYQRRCERGFDQAEVVARAASEWIDVPVAKHLRRTRKTGRQADRSYKDREEEMKDNPFRASQEVPKSILLVDDVWTTGATAIAAASALKAAGAKTVWMYTIAKG